MYITLGSNITSNLTLKIFFDIDNILHVDNITVTIIPIYYHENYTIETSESFNQRHIEVKAGHYLLFMPSKNKLDHFLGSILDKAGECCKSS